MHHSQRFTLAFITLNALAVIGAGCMVFAAFQGQAKSEPRAEVIRAIVDEAPNYPTETQSY